MQARHNTTPIKSKDNTIQCIEAIKADLNLIQTTTSRCNCCNHLNTYTTNIQNILESIAHFKIQSIGSQQRLQQLEKNITELYNELALKQSESEKNRKSYRKNLETLQILMYQKDYKQALERIDHYKKNIHVILDDISIDLTVKSVNDSINQAFYKSEIIEQPAQHHLRLRNIIEDDKLSMTIKEQLIFGFCFEQSPDEQDQILHHVTLEQVLSTKRLLITEPSLNILQSIIDGNEFNKEQAKQQETNKQNLFQNRIIIDNIKNYTNDSPALSKKIERLKSDKKTLENNISKMQRIETGKKKAIINISDVSGLNLFSEVYNSETSKKIMKRQRSLTSKKGQSNQDKKSKTHRNEKETQKKKLKKTLISSRNFK